MTNRKGRRSAFLSPLLLVLYFVANSDGDVKAEYFWSQVVLQAEREGHLGGRNVFGANGHRNGAFVLGVAEHWTFDSMSTPVVLSRRCDNGIGQNGTHSQIGESSTLG